MPPTMTDHIDTGSPDDIRWMQAALDEARIAWQHDDVPIGAVAVRHGEIIARGHNRREIDGDPTAHAELIAIRAASQVMGHWRLEEVTLYCTLEPCAMCAGAMILARLPRLVYAAPDPKAGAGGSVIDLLNHPQLNHRVAVTDGVLADESAELIRAFFAGLRAQGQK
jgi:tRNA(adenine34) deaminase